MRLAFVAVAVCSVVLGTESVSASPFTTALDALHTELATRRDNDFGGTLDATKKMQQKAVLKCLALIDKPSASIQDDAKTLSGVAKLLEKAYPGEMDPAFVTPLRSMAADALDLLFLDFPNDMSLLEYRVGTMVPSPRVNKAAKLLAAAHAAQDDPNPANLFSVLSRNDLKAWKLALKGLPLTEGAVPLPAPAMQITAGGFPYTADAVGWKYHSKSRRIELNAPYYNPGTGASVFVHVSGFVIPGATTVTMDSGYFEGHDAAAGTNGTYTLVSGSIGVGTLDLRGHTFSGTFDMNVTGASAFEVLGTFTATWYLNVVND